MYIDIAPASFTFTNGLASSKELFYFSEFEN